MEKWKTTVLGILVAVVGVINLVVKLLKGEPIVLQDILILFGTFGAGGGVTLVGGNQAKMAKALRAKGIIMPLILVMLIPVMLFGCATPWQNKATSSYTTALSLVKVAEQTAQPSCVANTLPADRCGQLRTIYGDIKSTCKVTGETLILSFYVTDKAQLASMMANFQESLTRIQKLVNEYIDFYNSILKDRKGVPPKGVISPALLQIIIQGFIALMGELPGLISSINTWNQSAVDIPALTKMINDAYTALPVW
jgi:hypothetical protein